MSMLEEIKEYEDKLVEKANLVDLNLTICFWISPFDTLEHRSGLFDNYTEAVIYAADLESTCKKHSMPYLIRVNGKTVEEKDFFKKVGVH